MHYLGYYDFFIFLIIFVKIIFFISVFYNLYLSKKASSSIMIDNVRTIKKQTEFMFIALMALLLIYLFNPWNKIKPKITTETYVLLSLFGWILLITADWDTFLKQSFIYTQILKRLKHNV